ncbi:OmpA/MotB family protein [Desulfobaculum bizertense]|uniref:Chemotaxis protein MotB n=1 Tax=Desulfobaculum bizertense DSM 18034 TaxID=1121442 RepID=A0A1T4W8J2_9BACT|nr:flagellar motor protein MotB [Desulfobaculum bizertense]UIJ39196.1 flagellar motor protein MotB [Desulfobaculum bizertense]SKA73586.1 chemotaxis protein MotB [Desulfobaculum bizertense DSM 18034]
MHDDPNNYLEPEKQESSDHDRWIVTFADLSLLLLVFFIMLFSMSTLDVNKFTDSFLSVKRALGTKSTQLMTAPVRSDDAVIMDSVRLQKQLLEVQRKVYSDVRTFITQKGIEGIVGAVLEKGKVVIRIPGDVMFENGQVELSPEGKKILVELKDVLIKKHDQKINIVGHTDDLPMRAGARFKDNWEISSLRAVYVLRYLMQLGIAQERLTATGLADLEPLYPNNTADNRARNRRVELVLEKMVSR